MIAPLHLERFRPSEETRGTNQNAARLFNERLVLALIRRHRALTKTELARATGLSLQTATVIVNHLQADGLLIRQAPQRGRIGQPSVPYQLNPQGAFSFGFKIGRRSADVVLLDFCGQVLFTRHLAYDYPLPDVLIAFSLTVIGECERALSLEQQGRIVGLGVALPNELWNWEEELRCPKGALAAWQGFDLHAALAAKYLKPVYVCNDATSAAAAELVFGAQKDFTDFLYVFIGSFIGGGLVLNNALVAGQAGNAASIGSMPVPDEQGHVQQLIRAASLYTLEQRLRDKGKPARWLWTEPEAWTKAEGEVNEWMTTAATSLAYAITSAASVLDLQALVLDGAFPPLVRQKLIVALREKLKSHNWQGLSPLVVEAGTIGHAAREIGAASLPFMAHFAPDREILLKEFNQAEKY